MPVTKSAKKKFRQDDKRERKNDSIRSAVKTVVKKARSKKTESEVTKAFRIIDRAAKLHIIHKNKAARLKSALSKLLPKKETKEAVKKESTKTPVKKSSPKKSKVK